ncbi:hypothetical protein [Nocardia thailandica]|uniref:hypothetical protein n=1 Tax=Nocardia thailandica TaxID=257275 RepID=UPI0005B8E965|nr:hypothetical protein [Nocardia thailandica]
MSDIQRGDLLPPSRHGTTWRESEYRTLADDLRAGNDLARTAAKLGRTPSAVRAALRHFVPPEEKVPGPDRERWIRQRLIAEPDWDWWACVVDAHRRTGSGLWLTRHEHSIRIGWRRRTPLPALAQELGTSELTVAEFLRGLGLVDSLEEAADRLGATPGLALAKRIAAARDASATARWILVVDGAAGTTRARNALVRRHVSQHETRAAAEATRDRLLGWHARVAPGTEDAPVWWTIAERGLGSAAGRTYSGTFAAPPHPRGVRADALRPGDLILLPGAGEEPERALVGTVTQARAGAPVLVDLGTVAGSRVRRVIEFEPSEQVEVTNRPDAPADRPEPPGSGEGR